MCSYSEGESCKGCFHARIAISKGRDVRAVFAAYHDDWAFGRRLLHSLTAVACTLGLFAQAGPGSRPTFERAQRDSQAGLKLAQNGDLTGAESQLRLAVDLEPQLRFRSGQIAVL